MTVKVNLTDDKEITPELVAEVRGAMNLERRQRDRRRSRAARRAIDRMAAVRPGEIDRIVRQQGKDDQ